MRRLKLRTAKYRVFTCTLFVLFFLLYSGCHPPPLPQKTFLIMGTFFTITLPADRSAYLEPASTLSANKLYQLEKQLSLYQPNSEICLLNQAAGLSAVELSKDAFKVLVAAKTYSELSQGAFDVTVTPYLRIWGLKGNNPPEAPPPAEMLRKTSALVGYQNLVFSNQTAFLTHSGMEVDLGGIAKGFAVDEVAKLMLQHGVSNVLINLGGNLRALGSASAKTPWRIAVQNPFDKNSTLGVLELRENEAVATSGNYERFLMLGKQRYCHIVDPRSGQPVSHMAGVTILTQGENAAMEADILSTTLFVLGEKAGQAFLAQHFPEAAVMFVPDDVTLTIKVNKEFAERFKPHEKYKNNLTVISAD